MQQAGCGSGGSGGSSGAAAVMLPTPPLLPCARTSGCLLAARLEDEARGHPSCSTGRRHLAERC